MQNKQLAEEIRQYNQSYQLQVKEYEEGIRQFNEEIARLKKKDEQENKLAIEKLEMEKKQLEEEKRQFDMSYEFQQQKFKAEQIKLGQGVGGVVGKAGSSNIQAIAANTKPQSNTGTSAAYDRSVIDLGRGPLSTAGVADLIASGDVKLNSDGTVSNTGKVSSPTLERAQAISNMNPANRNANTTRDIYSTFRAFR
jgi:TolA-binding protein